ncbi:MAG: hypothetical protein GEV03_13660 [Streptosporangiales bacterium]|nr:hypothetical protein [Streptosporangiales bacterium]
MRRIRVFLLVEAAAFAAAALVHFGVLADGYQHREASIAESVIAAVLLVGLALSWPLRSWVREVGVAAQGFALFGTLVGIFTIAVGVGPRTVPDVVYHVGIVAVLAAGLAVALRAPAGDAGRSAA